MRDLDWLLGFLLGDGLVKITEGKYYNPWLYANESDAPHVREALERVGQKFSEYQYPSVKRFYCVERGHSQTT